MGRLTMPQRLECPYHKDHRPKMVHDRRHGVTTGEMFAWCYECQRELKPEPHEPREHGKHENLRGRMNLRMSA